MCGFKAQGQDTRGVWHTEEWFSKGLRVASRAPGPRSSPLNATRVHVRDSLPSLKVTAEGAGACWDAPQGRRLVDIIFLLSAIFCLLTQFLGLLSVVKAMVFPVVMYGCESWTVKKAEHRRINALELWCWRRLLRVPWTARRSNQSILKEISPGCSLEGLKLKLQYFGYLMRRVDSLEKTLMLGRIGAGGEGDNRG